MSTVSYQEKCLYIELAGMGAFLGTLYLFVVLDPSPNPHAFSRALVGYTVMFFSYSFFVNRRSRFKAGDYRVDERDQMIESKGIRASHAVLLVGVVYLVIRIEDMPSLSARQIFNRLVAMLVLSSLARIVQMLRLYRAAA